MGATPPKPACAHPLGTRMTFGECLLALLINFTKESLGVLAGLLYKTLVKPAKF